MSSEEAAQEPGDPLDLSGVHFDEDNCAICLEPVKDRCILPRCFHSCFCLGCIVQWAQTQEKEKTCPLCVTPVGQHVLHALDPVSQRFLTFSLKGGVDAVVYPSVLDDEAPDEAPDEEPPQAEQAARPRPDLQTIRRREEAQHQRKMNDALRARRRVYRYHLYAKHVGSNRYTKYRPYPGTAGFRKNPSYARLLSAFLQRELQVWPHLDIPFLSFYIPALLSHVDIRSDTMLQRLEDWIGNRDDAHLLAHEMEMFIRSGRGSMGLDQYDTCPWLQYDPVDDERTQRT